MNTSKPENFEAWLRDLETTTDPQGIGQLTSRNGDCCLGRACKVALKAGVQMHVESDEYGYVYYDEASAQPPEPVTEWLGLGEADADALYTECIAMNDGEELPFSEIAKRVREKVTLCT